MVQSKAWMIVSLVLTCLVAAFALSQVYAVTKPRIEGQAAAALQASLAEVLPAATTFTELEHGKVWSGNNGSGIRVGIVFKTQPRGYGGPITVVVGLDTSGIVTGVGIGADMKETPGLGLKAHESWFRDQFRGKTADQLRLKRDNGAIDAISAATITSRAVTDGIRQGIEQHLHYLTP